MSVVVPKKRMTTQIILNSVHWQPGTHRYRYNFPQPIDFSKNNAQTALSQYALYNSTANISPSLGNDGYRLVWINGQTVDVTIEPGYYSFSDLNSHVQFVMSQQGWYLVSTANSSQAQFHISVNSNSIQYKAEVTVYALPSSMPTGFSYPSNATWTLPTEPSYPQIILSPGLQLADTKHFSAYTNTPDSQRDDRTNPELFKHIISNLIARVLLRLGSQPSQQWSIEQSDHYRSNPINCKLRLINNKHSSGINHV
jgi:hypothetical protein